VAAWAGDTIEREKAVVGGDQHRGNAQVIESAAAVHGHRDRMPRVQETCGRCEISDRWQTTQDARERTRVSFLGQLRELRTARTAEREQLYAFPMARDEYRCELLPSCQVGDRHFVAGSVLRDRDRSRRESARDQEPKSDEREQSLHSALPIEDCQGMPVSGLYG